MGFDRGPEQSLHAAAVAPGPYRAPEGRVENRERSRREGQSPQVGGADEAGEEAERHVAGPHQDTDVELAAERLAERDAVGHRDHRRRRQAVQHEEDGGASDYRAELARPGHVQRADLSHYQDCQPAGRAELAQVEDRLHG